MATTVPAQSRAARRRSLTRPAPMPLRFELLEDRSLPSFSFPIFGNSWNEFGPRNIAIQPSHIGEDGQGTSSPGNITSSGRITDVAPDLTNINVFYAATAGGGVWKTTDRGDTWRPLTDRLPASTPGLTDDLRTLSMGSVTLSPFSSNIIYAGEGEQNFSVDSYAGNGILKSTDGGATWRLITGPGGAFLNSTIPQIIVVPNPAAPSDPNQELVFALIGRGGDSGIWRSDDAGNNWIKITPLLNTENGVPSFVPLTDMAVDPSNPEIAYVAVGLSGSPLNGIYRTEHALSNTPAFDDPPNTPPNLLQGTPWSIVFGGNGGPQVPSGILIGRINFVLAPSSPSTLYVLAGDGASDAMRGVYRSQDRGTNWREYATVPTFLPGQSFYNMAIAVDPTNENRFVMAGLDGIAYTDQALLADPNAVDWDLIQLDPAGEGPHVDYHTIAFTAPNENGERQILAGSDGGMFRTASLAPDGEAVDWESANGVPGPFALNVVQYVGVALHPASADEMLGGTQDNGTIRFFDDGRLMSSQDLNGNPIVVPEAWAGPVSDGGDGGDLAWDTSDPNIVYQISPVGSKGTAGFVTKSTDGGRTWTAITSGIINPQNALFYPPIAIDPSLPERLFVGTDVINESTDGGATWHRGPTDYPFPPTPVFRANDLPFVTARPPEPGGPSVSAIGIGRSDPYIMYVGVTGRSGPTTFQGPGLYRINVFNGPAAVPWLDVSPRAAGHPPGGSPMPPITGAPAEPQANDVAGLITAIAVDPFDSNIVVVSTSGHQIWRTTDGGSTWTLMSTAGLPNGALQQEFNDVAIDPNLLTVGGQIDDILFVATNIGVYTLQDPTQPVATQVWTRVGGNEDHGFAGYLSDARVDDIEINTATGLLVAGTHGRGIWQYQIRPYVSGIVFDDIDGDGNPDENGTGMRDPGDDAGIANIRVVANRIEPAPPFEAASTFTQDDPNGERSGFYVFRSLEEGTYDITLGFGTRVPVDPGQTFYVTTPPPNLVLDETSTIPNSNIGLFRRISISGVKFDDRNVNGAQDLGEAGLPGWVFEIYDSTNPAVTLGTAVSDGNGNFAFTGVGQLTTGGQFRIRELAQQGWIATTGADIAVPAFTSGQNLSGLLFGNVISGSLVISGLPASIPAGTPVAFTVTVFDQNGAVFTNYRGTVHFTSSDVGQFTGMPVDYTFTAADNGVHNFVAVFTTAGVQSLNVASTTDLGIAGGGAAITVNALAATQLRLFGMPAAVPAGQVVPLTVSAADVFGNPTSHTGTVNLSSTDPNAIFPASVALTNGSGVFDAVLRTTGFQTLTATDAAGVLGAGSATTGVNAAAGNTLIVEGMPGTVVAGIPFTITVRYLDPFGNPALGPVSFGSDDPLGILPGTYDFTVADGGVKQFSITLQSTGPRTLTVGSSTGASTSASAIVTASAAVTLPSIFALGSDEGGVNFLRVHNQDTSVRTQFQPFDSALTGGVRAAIAGTPTGFRTVAVPGPGLYQEIKVFESDSPTLVQTFPGFEPTFTGGMFVATADFNGDSWADYIFSPDVGGGPRVQIVDGLTGSTIADFFGIDDPAFRGGARTAAADLNGDNIPDLVVAAGHGGGPRVAIYDGSTLFGGAPVKLVGDFFVFEETLRNGVYVAAGDFNADGFAELVAGGGPDGGPRVMVLDGQSLTNGGQLVQLANFFAGDPANRGGIRLAVKNLDGDQFADLLTGSGPGTPARVTAFSGAQLIANAQPPELFALDASLGSINGGVFVG